MCGYYGDKRRTCKCTPPQISRYHNRLSGPLRDRLDLVVEVEAVPITELTQGTVGESSAAVRARVLAARARQAARPVRSRANATLTAPNSNAWPLSTRRADGCLNDRLSDCSYPPAPFIASFVSRERSPILPVTTSLVQRISQKHCNIV